MSKSVRYKLHKTSGGKKKKRNVGKKVKKGKNFLFSKPLKILFFIVGLSILGYWFFVAYTTVRDIKIMDVIGDESEVVEFADSQRIRRTLIIYEQPNSTEEKNLFLLAVIYNADTSEALIYHFPKDLYINDYFANKYISVENLTYAGESYMYNEKYAYVVRQIEEQMAINFDSYILFGSEIGKNFVSADDNWGRSKEDVLQIFSKLSFVNLMPKYYKVHCFEEYFHSNMSFLEMYAYFQNIRGIILSDNHEYINLGDESFVRETELGSGANVKALSLSAVDKSLRENIDISRTKDLRAEHVKVEIYNGSEIAGHASVVARKIHNAGCRVIRYENASKPYEQTKIYVSDKEKFVAGLEVVNDIVKDAIIIEGRPEFLTTGDIVVILGLNE
jgi:hypothetical protein